MPQQTKGPNGVAIKNKTMEISKIIFIAGLVAALFGSFLLFLWLSTLLAKKAYERYEGDQPLYIVFGLIARIVWTILWVVLIIVIEDGKYM